MGHLILEVLIIGILLLRVLDFGVLIIRILLFKVLYSGPPIFGNPLCVLKGKRRVEVLFFRGLGKCLGFRVQGIGGYRFRGLKSA